MKNSRQTALWAMIGMLLVAMIACGQPMAHQPTPTVEGISVLAGCDRKVSDLEIYYDFSEGHPTVAETGYAEECWAGDDLIFLDSTIELDLPNGVHIGPQQSPRFHIGRYFQSRYLHSILIEMPGPLTLDETYAYASELAERYEVPTDNLDRWYSRYQMDPDRRKTGSGSNMTRMINDELGIGIRASLSFVEGQPYVVYMVVVWSSEILRTETPISQ